MSLTIANTGTSANPDINSSTDATSYANTSWTPSGDMAVAYVYSKVGSGTANIPTISGNSLTWNAVTSASIAVGFHRLTLIAAQVTSPSAGVTTISFDGQTQVACCVSFFSVTECDLTSGTSSAFVQVDTNSGTGTTAQTDFAAAASSNNRPIAGYFHWTPEATAPRANWTELDDLSGTATDRGVQTQYRSDAFETTGTATWATSATVWLAVGAEIKESVSAAARELRRHVVKSQARHRASRW
jgi:hypothetical protein